MAEKKAEEAESAAPPKKKGKLLLFIIIGVVLLVLVGGGAAYFLLKKSSHPADEEGGDEPPAKEQKAAKKDKSVPPAFVKLDPFTVKLQVAEGTGTESYLQTTPELRVLDAAVGEQVKQYTPEIRHRVLLILSSKKAADVADPKGMEKLADEIRVAINLIIDGPKLAKKKKGGDESHAAAPGAEDSVQAVLFTSFIVQ